MTDGLQGLREDVAFMRTLAEEGRNAPLRGGEVSVAAGLTYGGASFLTYAASKGWLGAAFGDAISWVWIAAGVAFFLVLFLSIRRNKGERGANAPANRAANAAWLGVGLAIFAIFGAFIFASARNDQWVMMTLLAPVILALYGAAWAVAGGMTGRTWIKGVAGLSFVLSVLTGWLAGTDEQWLVYGVALLLTAFLPGLVMLRQARARA